jgi:hypothetical protein
MHTTDLSSRNIKLPSSQSPHVEYGQNKSKKMLLLTESDVKCLAEKDLFENTVNIIKQLSSVTSCHQI